MGKCLGFAAGVAAAAAARQRYLGVVFSGWTGGSQRASTPIRAVQEPKCDVWNGSFPLTSDGQINHSCLRYGFLMKVSSENRVSEETFSPQLVGSDPTSFFRVFRGQILPVSLCTSSYEASYEAS